MESLMILKGFKYFLNELKETQYHRNQREPLGKKLQRNYIFPEEVKKRDFSFGIPTVGCK
jgi:hypothetical protein